MQRLSISGYAAALAIACSALATGAHAKEGIEENNESVYLARDFVFVESPAIEGYLRRVCKRLLDARSGDAEADFPLKGPSGHDAQT